MTGQQRAERPMSAAIARLQALSPLDDCALRALHAAADRPRRFRAKREFLSDGRAIVRPLLILDGWAARQRVLQDGRRQIIDLLLPGDLIDLCDHERPVASSAVVALTEVDACSAPDRGISPALEHAYAVSKALGEAYLSAQIVRLGRMNALERIADLLLELFERLKLAGLVTGEHFAMPLTQDVIADAVGLTPVHVNRTLQTLRRQGAIELSGRELVLPSPNALRRMVGRVATRVTLG